MDFSNTHPAVIAIAANNLNWTKSVAINDDGTLDWFGEEGHPTDQEMSDALSAAQTEYDTNGALKIAE